MVMLRTDYSVKGDRVSRIVTLPDGRVRRTALKIPARASPVHAQVLYRVAKRPDVWLFDMEPLSGDSSRRRSFRNRVLRQRVRNLEVECPRVAPSDAINVVPSHCTFSRQGRCARIGEQGVPCSEAGRHSARPVCS